MRLDFWQVSDGPIERVVGQIAPRVLGGGDRLLIVDADAERRAAISRLLWEADGFLANGEEHSARQPILLSAACVNDNGAQVAVLADGIWREEAERFERTILLFGADRLADARALWRQYDAREEVTRGFFAQESGKWVKKA